MLGSPYSCTVDSLARLFEVQMNREGWKHSDNNLSTGNDQVIKGLLNLYLDMGIACLRAHELCTHAVCAVQQPSR
jgi:hypothetical protein